MKFSSYLSTHRKFCNTRGYAAKLVSVATGVAAPPSVNEYDVFNLGKEVIVVFSFGVGPPVRGRKKFPRTDNLSSVRLAGNYSLARVLLNLSPVNLTPVFYLALSFSPNTTEIGCCRDMSSILSSFVLLTVGGQLVVYHFLEQLTGHTNNSFGLEWGKTNTFLITLTNY